MPRMGRRRVRDRDLPARVYLKHGAYYFVSAEGKWIRLAPEGDKAGMHRALADLADGSGTRLRAVLERYRDEVLPMKAAKTQADQRRQLDILIRDFGGARPADVKPSHVAAFLDAYPAPKQANRIVALLSHVYKKAIRWGDAETNPCRGVERNKEGARRVYVDGETFWQAWRDAPARIQLAMELAYLTGQRQADVLKLRWSQCQDDGIHFRQGKTGNEVVIECGEWLHDVLARCKDAQGDIRSVFVLADEHGQRITSSGFQTAWQRFMRDRPDRFQFRDIRKKSANDAANGEHLGHKDARTLRDWYLLKPKRVQGVTGREEY